MYEWKRKSISASIQCNAMNNENKEQIQEFHAYFDSSIINSNEFEVTIIYITYCTIMILTFMNLLLLSVRI